MKTYDHLPDCPNYFVIRDPSDCTCEKYWDCLDKAKAGLDLQGTEKLRSTFMKLCETLPEETLLHWLAILETYADPEEVPCLDLEDNNVCD